MNNNITRSRLGALMLLDQKLELKNRETAKELHSLCADIARSKSQLADNHDEMVQFEEDKLTTMASIEELTKELAKNQKEEIRLNQKIIRATKKNKKNLDVDFTFRAADEKMHLKKNMKLCLIRRCTGVVLDDKSSNKTTSGFVIKGKDLEMIDIPHAEMTLDGITSYLWEAIRVGSTHFNDFEALFSQAKPLVTNV